jgi:hypothetical protein
MMALILSKGLACVVVAFDHRGVVKPAFDIPMARPPAPAKSSTLRTEKPLDPRGKPPGSPELAFPNCHNLPSLPHQIHPVLSVSRSIPFQLWKPKIRPGLRQARQSAIWMSMPEATMDEYHFAQFPEHDVGMSRQTADVEPVSIAESIDNFPDPHFWFGIP